MAPNFKNVDSPMPINHQPYIAQAREFCDYTAKRQFLPNSASQRHKLLKEMCELSARYCAENGLSIDEASWQLDKIVYLIDSVWYITAPYDVTQIYLKMDDADNPDTEMRRKFGLMWKRHNPAKSSQDGYESDDFFSAKNEEIDEEIAKYLSMPWIRSAVFDWMLLDISLTNEICGFGEHIKMTTLSYMGNADSYYKSRGNISEMRKHFKKLNKIYTIIWNSISIYLIWAALYYSNIISISPLTLTAFAYTSLCIIALRCWSYFSERKRLLAIKKAGEREADIFSAMLTVWSSLEGQALNPTRIRSAMQNAADRGAVWPNSAWALIDRIVAIDPNAFIVRFGKD